MSKSLVLVRATLNLPDGIRAGEFYWVDASIPWIAKKIASKVLVIEDEPEQVVHAEVIDAPSVEPDAEQTPDEDLDDDS